MNTLPQRSPLVLAAALALGSVIALSSALAAVSAQTSVAPPATKTPAKTPEAFVVHQAVLYQPDPVLKERFGGDGLIATFYLRQVEAEAKKILATAPRGLGTSGVLISTVRPGSSPKIWFAFPTTRRLPTNLRLELEKKLATIPAPVPTGGPVAMGLAFSIWGGDKESQEMMRQGPPIPDAWRLVAARSKKTGMPFDQMLGLAWPQ